MEFKKNIYWHQGLFLQPQHFQLQELSAQFKNKPLYKLTTPYFVGISQCDISEEALEARSLELRNIQIIFQDKTFIEFPGNAAITPRSFEKIWVNSDEPLDVYVGLRKMSQVSPNVTVVDDLNQTDLGQTRMVSLSSLEEVVDLYSHGPTANVPTAEYLVGVFFGPELPSLDDYHLIKIARLERDSSAIKLSSQYIPPCYNISGSATLFNCLKDIRDDLTGRLYQLQEYKIPSSQVQTDFDPDYFVMFHSIQTLNRLVPTLTHITDGSHMHPWDVYGFLRVAIGELSSFSEKTDVFGRKSLNDSGLPDYDHFNLESCFNDARRLINQLLNEISVGPEFLGIMQPKDNYLTVNLPQELFRKRNRFYLIIQASARAAELKELFLQNARLAAPSELPAMIDHALPGIELIEITSPPQGLPRRKNSNFYRIEQLSAEWEIVETDGELALFWPDSPENLKAEVVVLRG